MYWYVPALEGGAPAVAAYYSCRLIVTISLEIRKVLLLGSLFCCYG